MGWSSDASPSVLYILSGNNSYQWTSAFERAFQSIPKYFILAVGSTTMVLYT